MNRFDLNPHAQSCDTNPKRKRGSSLALRASIVKSCTVILVSRSFALVIMLLLIPIVGTHAAAEERDPQLEKIFADWQKRQHWFEAIEYEVRGQHFVPQGSYTDYLPPGLSGLESGHVNPKTDLQASVSYKFLLDFANGRHRREIREQEFHITNGNLCQSLIKDIFDGSVMKCLIPKETNGQPKGAEVPEITVVSGNMKNGTFKSNFYPVFFAQGHIYTPMEPILPGKLRNEPDHDYFYVHGTGVIAGRPCLILRTKTLTMGAACFEEYWVDSERTNAIVRYVSYSGPTPLIDINIRYRFIEDHWLPESWQWLVLSKGKPLYYENMRVEKVVINPPIDDRDFAIEIKPGMLVEERVDAPTSNALEWAKSRIRVYRFKENGDKQIVPDPFRRGSDARTHLRAYWIWGTWMLILGGVFVYIMLRRRRLKIIGR